MAVQHDTGRTGKASLILKILTVLQLCYGPVVTYCMVYYYTKRVTLARLLANKGPAIYIVHFEQVFCYTSIILFSSHFSVTDCQCCDLCKRLHGVCSASILGYAIGLIVF